MPQTMIEKIVQNYAVNLPMHHEVHAGDYVTIQPRHVMTHDNTGAVIKKFKELGVPKIKNPRQPVFALDHNIQDTSEENLRKYQRISDFAKEMGVDFYPAGRGIGHQIMCEEGYAFPGSFVVASDSHSNMYGGLGCLGTPVVRTDAASIWATGTTWWQVPPIVQVVFTGSLLPGVTGKDVIITLCGLYNRDEVLNHAIEFCGDGVRTLSIDQRLAIANMTTEWGALVGLFPIDDVTFDWLEKRVQFIQQRGLEGVPSDIDGNGQHPRLNPQTLQHIQLTAPTADPDAQYAKRIEFDLSTVRPYVSGPNHVKTMQSVTDIEKQKIKIHKAYLVSCVNSRVEDIAAAAEVVNGKRFSSEVKFYISAASREVQEESKRRGDWQKLIQAGAIELPPGCGPCIGLGEGLLEDNEVGISATNRNFKGRMGSPKAIAYLASPAVVAASAIHGYICGPVSFDSQLPKSSMFEFSRPSIASKVEIVDGFPETVTGNIVFCHQDNLNTDGIYPGKYTYKDDMTPEEQAEVVMENYDPNFRHIVQKGDILVGGFNFGTGSSREQAATALKYRGIQLVVAGSFNQTYQRNALNNGFLVVESPDFVKFLKQQLGTDQLTIRLEEEISIHFASSTITFRDQSFSIGPVGTSAQELIVVGGLENWIRKKVHA
ncbi:MAG: homoaconitase [bacterium]|nr:homoaconitase [bacterium]